ncbi:NAD(P)-dependent alcohol dehydrogenase [Chloroflexota bacterium]
MKAVICTRYGPPEVLQLAEVEKPVPQDNEILVKIRATTVHRGDARIRAFDVPAAGWLAAKLILGFRGPRGKILGMELSGEVEAVGKNVTKFKVGDQVFGAPKGWAGGAYAQYRCISENGLVAIKPSNASYEEAAALTNGALIALNIIRKVNVQSGQTVLVYGASGSVGTFALQLAKYYGADVTGVCSTGNFELVKSLGADHVIDYTQGDFTESSTTYDIVIDAVSKLPSSQRKRLLKEGGAFSDVHKVSIKLKVEDLIFVRGLVEEGKLSSVIDKSYPLGEMVEAHRYVDQGHKRGNVAITVSHDD